MTSDVNDIQSPVPTSGEGRGGDTENYTEIGQQPDPTAKHGDLTRRILNVCVKAYLTVSQLAENPSDNREWYVVKDSEEDDCSLHR